MLQDEWLEETGQQAIVWGSDDMLGLDAHRIGTSMMFVMLCCGHSQTLTVFVGYCLLPLLPFCFAFYLCFFLNSSQ